MKSFQRTLQLFTAGYAIAATAALVWLSSLYFNSMAKADEIRSDRPAAILAENPESKMRWKTLTKSRDLEILLGDPVINNLAVTAWETRSGTFRFYVGPDQFVRVMAQLPDKIKAKPNN